MRLHITRSTEPIGLLYISEDGKTFKPVITEWIGDFNYIYNVGSKFYFLTNYNAPYGRIIAFDYQYPQEENWQELLKGDKDNILIGANISGMKLVIKSMMNFSD